MLRKAPRPSLFPSLTLPRPLSPTTMDDDAEVLDWGNEDDESQAADSYKGQTQARSLSGTALASSGDQEEVEDAVSLGGDEDEDVYPYATESVYREQTPQPQPGDTRSRTPSQLDQLFPAKKHKHIFTKN